ncbi:hypothetical protein QJS10_CPB21g00980 [Acorus calamus]|uniref:DUF4283 domain-containing protein n=1 Tax=Acorus calamus TaxID=4465 RepID=A0AAV9C5V0_ACOCL|nr:hypothetical protein QJS10_CPB21g00980 [Acorus calamus]
MHKVEEGGSLCIELPDSFDPSKEEALLRNGVLAEAQGWTPSAVTIKEVLTKQWACLSTARVQAVGGNTFFVSTPNTWIQHSILRKGKLMGEWGSLSCSQWRPEFGTLKRSHQWKLTVTGVPLHWLEAGCIGLILAKFGKIVEILHFGRGEEGRTVKVIILEAPDAAPIPPVVFVTHAGSTFKVELRVESDSVRPSEVTPGAPVKEKKVPLQQGKAPQLAVSRKRSSDRVDRLSSRAWIPKTSNNNTIPRTQRGFRDNRGIVLTGLGSRGSFAPRRDEKVPVTKKALIETQKEEDVPVTLKTDVADTQADGEALTPGSGDPDTILNYSGPSTVRILPRLGPSSGPDLRTESGPSNRNKGELLRNLHMPVIEAEDSDCPFGPGSMGPGWAWS